MTNKVLGGGALDGNLGLNPTFADFDIPLGRVVQSVDNEGYIQYWIIEETLKAGGNALANGLYANSTTLKEVAGGVSKLSVQNRQAIEAAYKAQGYNNVFFFEDGFTYTESNDIGIYEDGTAWTYADAGALPVTVAAGTVPSEGVYEAAKVALPVFETVADMKSATYLSTLPEFTRIEWQGYYAQSDGGGNWGVLRFGAHADNGGSIFSIDTNTYIEANLKGSKVNVRKFGARGDCTGVSPNGHNDTQAFKSAITFARGYSIPIFVPAGKYRISERLFFGPLSESDIDVVPTQSYNICTGLIGCGEDSTYLIPDSGLNGDVLIDLTGLREKVLKNFKILSFDSFNCPAVGILTARFNRPNIGAPTNNDWGIIQNVTVDKYFSLTPYLAHATEEINVSRCKFRTDHNDALGAFVSVSDLSKLPVEIESTSETNLEFTTGSISNLHQKHLDCDYYMGSASPTESKPSMMWISGAQMFEILRPFFNNNAHKFDCIRVEKHEGQAFTFGIHVSGANYHQTTKSGLIMESAHVNCSLNTSSRTVDFTDGQVVLNGYSNGFSSEFIEGDLHINAGAANLSIGSCRDLYWLEYGAIESSKIGVRRDVITDDTDRVATNDFTIEHEGNVTRVLGFYSDASSDSASQVSIGRSDYNGHEVSTEFGSFNSDMYKANFKGLSLSQFNYFAGYRNSGVQEVGIRRGGFFESLTPSGGYSLTAPNGELWTITVDNNGQLLIQQ